MIYSKFEFLMIKVLLLFLMLNRSSQGFNFDTDNIALYILPIATQKVLQDVSPAGSDASLIFRGSIMLHVGWFDAIAPYHPTAIGIHTQHPRSHRLIQSTNKNKNIAMIYSNYHILMSLLPKRKQVWDKMMTDLNLDPNLESNDIYTPEGLGIIAGKNVVAARINDGINQLGDKLTKNIDKKYNRQPFSDYTGYVPKNTAYELLDPSSWQPAFVTQNNGIFRIQQFVTPQMGEVTPYSYKKAQYYKVAKPCKSDIKNLKDYIAQAQILVNASAELDDRKKITAQFFDNKFRSLGFTVFPLITQKSMTLEDFVHYEVTTNMASFDTSIAVWKQKKRHDAVRPFSAIAHIWKNQTITAWGGPGKGTVNDLPANQWRSYMNVADHPEYPSGSASFCAAHTTAARRLFNNNDTFPYKIPIMKGQSVVEPGVTPSQDMLLQFNTWTELLQQCMKSRVWAGVHFPDAVEAGKSIGLQVGECAYQFVKAHISGQLLPNPSSNCKY